MSYRNLSRAARLHRGGRLWGGHHRNHQTQTLIAENLHAPKYCDVFINHRGIDTKRNLASLLYDYLYRQNARPFLDKITMGPGENLKERINTAIRDCKVGVAVFSPNYGESYYCLYELAMMMECKKKVIPIFCDVQPSEVQIDNGSLSHDDQRRFNWALEEAKSTVGLVFDSMKGNWSDILRNASDVVMTTLSEIESSEEENKLSDTK